LPGETAARAQNFITEALRWYGVNRMLQSLSIDDSLRLRNSLVEAGYTEATIQKHLGAAELPSYRLRNEPRLLDRTSEVTLLNSLLRWFWLGRSQTANSVAHVPPSLLHLLLEAGMLVRHGDLFAPTTMLLCAQQFLVASDHPSAIERGDSELVLWPNPTSRFLSRFTIRRRSRATLDLGTGSGILSLGAAAHSASVVATDLNPRVPSFVNFNARLNGIENIEMLLGDGFKPVAGRSFDLILSNPPFFITPRNDFTFCDNPLELDQLCRQLVKQAPSHLNQDGYMQMLCEWAQVSGQPWEERIAEWLKDSGCDAWVMKGLTQYPEEYAQNRISETAPNTGRDQDLYDGYMSYYRRHQVEAIHDGMIVMRRRSGSNWARIEEVPNTTMTGELGEMVLATFAAHDLLLNVESDERLLAVKIKLASPVRLEQVCSSAGGRWRADSVTLRLARGFPFTMKIQPLVAEFLATCDGTRTAGQAIQALALSVDAPMDTVKHECLAILRRLIERGFIEVTPQ
jgi:methylase of polypeptide subunit release factors